MWYACTWGPIPRPVTHFSKQLDPVSQRLPKCLKAMATTPLVVKEASQLTLGQHGGSGPPTKYRTRTSLVHRRKTNKISVLPVRHS
uniref:Uncharacterized protein n=1 Tax=Marmota marmota marmota TaxID=9994 RepID=A0A8C5ZMY6_MARMA